MFISEATVDAIRDRAQILEIVGEVVALQRRGTSHVGLCPFHAERSPSFYVRDQRYHCFGCGANGDSITFTMAHRGLTFPEAMEQLAARYQIPIVEANGRQEGANSGGVTPAVLYKINQVALEFFSAQLLEAPESVREYIASRGLTAEAISYYGIGFAPFARGGQSSLLERLKRKGVKEDILIASGLVRRGSRGELYEVFRGRLMFPVWIDPQRVAGFGGRTIPGLDPNEGAQKSAKYLNSPETPVYQKSKILFGVPQAIDAIRKLGVAYLVEGYLDVVGLSQVGVQNIVATCGTALTERHVKRLTNLAKRVVVLFDGDKAGRAAAAKSFAVFINSGIDAHAVFIPDNQDPDDIARKYGPKCQEFLDQLPRINLLDVYVGSLIEKYSEGATGTEGAAGNGINSLGAALKGRLCQELVQTLVRVSNTIERGAMLERAAMLLRVGPQELRNFSEQAGLTQSTQAPIQEVQDPELESSTNGSTIRSIDQLPRIDRDILAAVMARKDELCEAFLRQPELCQSVLPETRRFATELFELVKRSRADLGTTEYKGQVKALLRSFGPSWERHWRNAYEMLKDPAVSFERSLVDCSRAVRRDNFHKLVEKLELELGDVAAADPRRSELLLEKVAITKQLKGLVG